MKILTVILLFCFITIHQTYCACVILCFGDECFTVSGDDVENCANQVMSSGVTCTDCPCVIFNNSANDGFKYTLSFMDLNKIKLVRENISTSGIDSTFIALDKNLLSQKIIVSFDINPVPEITGNNVGRQTYLMVNVFNRDNKNAILLSDAININTLDFKNSNIRTINKNLSFSLINFLPWLAIIFMSAIILFGIIRRSKVKSLSENQKD
ncbi:MAG TPA: hypothetical protein VHP32_01715 [Ignavibacteria bacterium]|nr:hypothetical protein [Ignavibacteria bacterium]